MFESQHLSIRESKMQMSTQDKALFNSEGAQDNGLDQVTFVPQVGSENTMVEKQLLNKLKQDKSRVVMDVAKHVKEDDVAKVAVNSTH